MSATHRPGSPRPGTPALLALAGAATAVGLTACSTHQASSGDDRDQARAIPIGPATDDAGAPASGEPYDLTEPGSVVWRTQQASIVDTRDFPVQIADVTGPPARMGDILPDHEKPVLDLSGEPNNMGVGGLRGGPVTLGGTTFSALDRTGWVPPDPAIAVGPDHVVQVVNQSLAFYTKSGQLQFSAILGSQGSPGFFEDVGAGGFAFDPKCFYDHIAERYVVLALEYYDGAQESFVTIAISDDDDPNGVWYKYRTDAVINVGGSTYWWDYPGLGYDEEAWYVTSNLFGLNVGGFGGVGYRVFDKDAMLNGDPAVFATLRDGNSASVQSAQHFGDNQAPYFMSVAGGSALRITAITDPTTNPQIQNIDVAIPTFNGPGESDVAGGGQLSAIDARLFNVQWRDGNLYTAHNTSSGGTNKARWYHFDTNSWPASGSPTLIQSGEIDPGPGIETFFPAIYSDDNDNVGLVFGRSSASERVSLYVTGRQASDPAGFMAEPELVRIGTVSGTSGRWGDYFDMAIDPTDGTTFWAVGQTDEAGIGWDTWVHSFTVIDTLDLELSSSVPDAVAPGAGFDLDFTVDLGVESLVGTPVFLAGPDPDNAAPVAAVNLGGNTWRASIPGFDCDDAAIGVRIVANGSQSGLVTLPADGSAFAVAIGEFDVEFEDNFETDQGWTTAGAASAGQWERGVPVGGGDRGDPGTDFDGSGACFLTGNTDGDSDVDGGTTRLISPLLTYTGAPVLEYARWFSNSSGGAPFSDTMRVDISTDGGVSWNLIETVGPDGPEVSGGWIAKSFDLAGLVPDVGSLQVRFSVSDTGSGSVVEAGVDAVRLSQFGCNDACQADFDANGTVNVLDVVAFITAWQAEDPSTDIRADGEFNILDVVDFVTLWNAGCP